MVAWTKDTSSARFGAAGVTEFTSEETYPFGPEMNELTENRIPLDDLMVFHQLARSLNSSLDLDTILRTILDQMERIIAADMWTLLMLDESRKELYYAIASQNGEDAQSACEAWRRRGGLGDGTW